MFSGDGPIKASLTSIIAPDRAPIVEIQIVLIPRKGRLELRCIRRSFSSGEQVESWNHFQELMVDGLLERQESSRGHALLSFKVHGVEGQSRRKEQQWGLMRTRVEQSTPSLT